MGDTIRLAQVIANLLTNAAKYTTKPDRITVTLAKEEADAVVAVKDEGEGIAPELLPRIFDLFVQGDHTLARSQGGLGIGLTLVRRLVEMHNGQVTASSGGKGKGSLFSVRLPLLPESVRGDERPRPGVTVPRRGPSRRVLVVDDNVDAANSIAKILRLFGHEVECVYDGPSALALAETFRPDVFVLDIGLPGMDGYELARRLRADHAFQRTPLLAVTGYGQDEDRSRSREAGFNYHLAKPVDPEVLHDIVAVSYATT
jgi:two-component system CheB/CheR fusion protein